MGGGGVREGGRGEPGVKNVFAPTVVVYHIDIRHNRYQPHFSLPSFLYVFLPSRWLSQEEAALSVRMPIRSFLL